MVCPEIVLNFIKYVAFGLIILYALDQNKSIMHYVQRGVMIGGGMIMIEYIIQNICRDMRENFTTGPNINEEEEMEMIDKENMVEPEINRANEEAISGLNDLVDESAAVEHDVLLEEQLEKEIMQEDLEDMKQEETNKEPEYSYSYVHPDAMKLPEIRLPKCIQDNPCNVCPIIMGGTSDFMHVKPKPIKNC